MRNFICCIVALLLIATGCVRRARKRAFGLNAITAIYFHKPNGRLFRRCVRWLARHGYVFVSADAVMEMLRGLRPVPRGAAWLSFDDGCRELLQSVLPLGEAERIPVTLFIPSGIIAGDGKFPWANGNTARGGRHAITVAELQQIAGKAFVTIGGHTVNHVRTVDCTDEELRTELARSKQDLELWTGRRVRYFAYPAGVYNGHETGILRDCGYEMAVTTDNAFAAPGGNTYFVPRFSVADDISFPEAVCNMVGVWGPVAARVKRLLGLAMAGRRRSTVARTCDHASA